MFLRFRTGRWQDWGNLILGLWLVIAPWVLDFAAPRGNLVNNTVTTGAVMYGSPWNAWISGVIIFFVALWALIMPSLSWPEWINGIVGIWLFISPWVLDFTGLAREAWDAWIVGALVFILAAWALARLRSRPPIDNTYGPNGPYTPYERERPLGPWRAAQPPKGEFPSDEPGGYPPDRELPPEGNYPPERGYPPRNVPPNTPVNP